MFQKAIIIVAGGSGSRMHSETPKQFLKLNGVPVLLHTIQQFISYDSTIQIILVLPISHIHLWEELAMEYPLNHVIDVVEGGETRYQSVQNGMKILENKKNVKVVGVHDGVRPLVSQTTISTCFEHAYLTGNAIPFMPIDETLRKITEHTSHWVNRAEYVSIQTPQCFKTEILQNAYDQNYNHTFTDDASVVESIGQKMNLVAGNRENIKITRPEDLVFAEKLITQ